MWKEHGLHIEASMSFTSKSNVDSKDKISSKEAKIQIITGKIKEVLGKTRGQRQAKMAREKGHIQLACTCA